MDYSIFSKKRKTTQKGKGSYYLIKYFCIHK